MNKRLFAELRTAQWAFRLSVMLSVTNGLVILGQAFLLSRIITLAFLQQQPLDAVIPYLIVMVLIVLLRTLVNGANEYTASQIAIRIKEDLRQRLIQHIIQLGPAYTRGEKSGELVLAATEGIEALNAYFKDYIPGLFTAVLIPLVILLVVFPVDIATFVILLLTAPLIPFFMALIGMAAGRIARRNYLAMGRMSAHFMDVLQGLTTLKLFNRSRHQIETIARITEDFRQTTMGVLRIAFLSAFALELLATLSVAIVAVEIGLRLIAGTIQFEQAMFLLVIAPEFYLPLRALGMKFHAGTEGAAAANRIFDVLDTAPSLIAQGNERMPADLTMTFRDVTFSYDEQVAPTLADLNFTIRAGDYIALVGASGGGKTTIANLLLRFIQPSAGIIEIGGKDLQTLDIKIWRDHVAWVPQSPYIFNTTIADNIRLGRQDADMNAVEQAARVAHIHDFIMSLPDGYETRVGERGSRLSGGQAQRIAIARAILKDAPIVLLDEATSNLDPETERDIEIALHALLRGRTAIVIAHRLNTITRADNILVIEAGRIVEQGTHTSLLQQSGTYRQLVDSFGGMAYA